MDQIWTPLAILLWGVVGYLSLFVVLPVLAVLLFVLLYPLIVYVEWLFTTVENWRQGR